jgi:sugar O-acyltransferase (sialic acid O-acetyltransferase NeuD family)
MKKLGIFGTSGFARETADVAFELGYDPVLIARNHSEIGDWIHPYKVITEHDIDRDSGMMYSIGIGDNAVRAKIVSQFYGILDFVNLIHPSATFGYRQREKLESQRGIIVCAGVRFTNNILIGDFNIINLNSTIGHDVIIDDYVNISPGVSISGNVHLGSGCLVGTGASIIQGTNEEKLKIGSNTTVGAGSLVVKECLSNSVYFGVPVRKIR